MLLLAPYIVIFDPLILEDFDEINLKRSSLNLSNGNALSFKVWRKLK